MHPFRHPSTILERPSIHPEHMHASIQASINHPVYVRAEHMHASIHPSIHPERMHPSIQTRIAHPLNVHAENIRRRPASTPETLHNTHGVHARHTVSQVCTSHSSPTLTEHTVSQVCTSHS